MIVREVNDNRQIYYYKWISKTLVILITDVVRFAYLLRIGWQ
jgi:hypothetical protein